jgi:hypothetical protein
LAGRSSYLKKVQVTMHDERIPTDFEKNAASHNGVHLRWTKPGWNWLIFLPLVIGFWCLQQKCLIPSLLGTPFLDAFLPALGITGVITFVAHHCFSHFGAVVEQDAGSRPSPAAWAMFALGAGLILFGPIMRHFFVYSAWGFVFGGLAYHYSERKKKIIITIVAAMFLVVAGLDAKTENDNARFLRKMSNAMVTAELTGGPRHLLVDCLIHEGRDGSRERFDRWHRLEFAYFEEGIGPQNWDIIRDVGRALPFGKPALDLIERLQYTSARQRYFQLRATDEDLATIVNCERRKKEEDQKRAFF